MPDAILAGLILVPLALTFLLKSNAALAFLSLCSSFVLITFASADITNLTNNLSIQLTSSDLNLLILLLPLLTTLFIARKAYSGNFRMILQWLCALIVGFLLTLLAVPLLNANARANFSDSWGWEHMQDFQTPVIVAGVLISLFTVWLGKPKHDDHKKKHK